MVLAEKVKARWLQALTHLGVLLSLALLVIEYLQDQLTADPVREATLRTGRYTLILLTLSLACTPVYRALGLVRSKWAQGLRRQVIRVRRPLGLYAFAYASLHALTYVGLDYGFDLGLVKDEFLQKRFLQVGLAAFLILVPLAVTSTKRWVRRLGVRWTRLHRLVYLAALLAVVHFLWLVKADIRRPLTYGAVIAALLVARIPHLFRRQRAPAKRRTS